MGGAGPIVQISTSDKVEIPFLEISKVENNTDFMRLFGLFRESTIFFSRDFFFGSPQLENEEYMDVEIRFGSGKNQKGHRFKPEVGPYGEYYFTSWEYRNGTWDLLPMAIFIMITNSRDGGLNRHYADNGLPPVSIWEMKIVNDEVVLATLGRGVWTASLPELKGYEPTPSPTPLLPQIAVNGEGFGRALEGEYRLRSLYDSSFITVEIPQGEEVLTYRSPSIEANTEYLTEHFNLKMACTWLCEHYLFSI